MFRNLTEQSLMGMAIIQDDVVKYASKRLADIYGYSSKEMMSWKPKDFLKTIDPEFLELVKEQARKKQMGNKDIIIHYQVKIVKKTGEKRWVENFSKTIDYMGRPADFVTNIDITDRKKAEQKVKESEERWHTLVEEAPDIIINVDREGKILYINKTPVGVTPEEAIGTNVLDYVTPEYEETVKNSIEQVFQTGNPSYYEITARGPYDIISWYSTRLGAIKHNNKVISVMLITRDITEKKKSRTKTKRIRRQISNNCRTIFNGYLHSPR